MSSSIKIINSSWDFYNGTKYVWISPGDIRYNFLKEKLIDFIFPILKVVDKYLLLDAIVRIVNFIYIKFGFMNNNDKNDNLLWDQLTQNKLLDLRAILESTLPFINDQPDGENKRKLKKLEDLYLDVNERGQYTYTNTQYNRCIRYYENNETQVLLRPFIKEYFLDHLELLLFSIETCSNKLYVNWLDVLPIGMNVYKSSQLYKETVEKFSDSLTEINLINNYVDVLPGVNYQDFYNVMSNHLFHEIKNIRWLIYDIMIFDKPIKYISYLEQTINLDTLFADNMLSWSQLDISQTNTFTNQWNKFMNSTNENDNTVLGNFYFYFCKYHKNSTKLVNQGKLVLTTNALDDKNTNDNYKITPQNTRNAKIGIRNVPIDEIYLFFYNQLKSFRSTWYYYFTKIKKENYVGEINVLSNNQKINIYITPKNIYNFCESLTHFTEDKEFIQLPRHWYTLEPKYIKMFLSRIYDIDTPEKNKWFNINANIRRIYPNVFDNDLPQINRSIYLEIKKKIIDIVFESLIFHGLLSNFHPNKSISDNSLIISAIGSNDDRKITDYKWSQMKIQYFSGKNKYNDKGFGTDCYYFLTGRKYDDVQDVKSKDYENYTKSYFDFLSSDQIWTFTYAMNWASQISFYHRYINTRVIYITGSTGVGKSTQVPKLLMYSQKMLDYNPNGKIICTQPRVPPTVSNAKTISREMGVPIVEYNIKYDKIGYTPNYYVQFKHQKENHINIHQDSFLKIVTDGTLLEEIKGSPFLTISKPDNSAVDEEGNRIPWVQTFAAENKYDIVIVDEAHEHNTNMDLILTLVRDTIHVNNSIKLVIVSATMEDDEPIYRRYYRTINDNLSYPLSSFIKWNNLDRVNMDRRVHISPPGSTTQYEVKDIYLSKEESDMINNKNFVNYGIQKTIKVANSTNQGDMLLFMSGQADILKSVKEINANTPSNIIALAFYSELEDQIKEFIIAIHQTLSTYTRFKEDVSLDEKEITRRVPMGTYNRAIIIATNVAEASITLKNLKYVIDTGYSKVVIYDPLEGAPKTLTLPISNSSSVQRRGRVGRVASGVVYYLYNKEKIINNKTAYKIADDNLKNTLVNLLMTNPKDSPIISIYNDYNNINNLDKIQKTILTYGKNKVPLNIFSDIFLNPRPYISIIKKQYMYIPNIFDIYQFFTYYGKTDGNQYPTLSSLRSNLDKYLVENHDDYHYQKENVEFFSKSYTGYYDAILEDRNLQFYIIHPDENVIKRNMYTGALESIKISQSVTDEYYYYLFKSNGYDIENVKYKNYDIDYKNFSFLKFSLAMDEAKLQLLVMEAPLANVRSTIVYLPYSPQQQNVNKFFDLIDLRLKHPESELTIRTQIFSNISKLEAIKSIPILLDINNMLWYLYSFAYGNGIDKDVLALMTMMKTVGNIEQWIGPVTNATDISKFFDTHYNKNGDIYFLWIIWNQIKEILNSRQLFDMTKIDINMESSFYKYKEMYLRDEKLPFEQYTLIDNLYKNGKLNIEDELYSYISLTKMEFKDRIKDMGISKYIDILAKNNGINSDNLQIFLTEYFNHLFLLNKEMWLLQYRIKHKIEEGDNGNNSVEEINIIDWVQQHLLFEGMNSDPNHKLTKWDTIFESYIRTFSVNLIKNMGFHYLKISNGVAISPNFWSKNVKIEKTFLKSSSEYLLYHTIEISSDSISISYLTPVKLEWVINLNPIYYYYLFFDKSLTLYHIPYDIDVEQAIQIIKSSRKMFNTTSLISYLDQINNPVINKMFRDKIESQNRITK